jgi:hypothetical protein
MTSAFGDIIVLDTRGEKVSAAFSGSGEQPMAAS